MKTLKNNPNLMTVICNIQALNEKINADYDKFKDFSRLELMTEPELYNEIDKLIPLYNKAVINKLK